jgi:predicted RNase H-like HicB family nuclease
MTTATPKTLEQYLEKPYPYKVIPDPEGGFVIEFPDLPGCFTQVETADEIPAMAESARSLWIQTAYELGRAIPEPSVEQEEYSGQFRVRLPRSLHRALAEGAASEGVSLNQYVLHLLSSGSALSRPGVLLFNVSPDEPHAAEAYKDALGRGGYRFPTGGFASHDPRAWSELADKKRDG